ncbi:hypothetical protein SprV_0401473100 [Sparganum proliferum]
MNKLLLLSVLLAYVCSTLQEDKKQRFNENPKYKELLKKIEDALDVFIGNGIGALGKWLASFLGQGEPTLKKILDVMFQQGSTVWHDMTAPIVKQAVNESAPLLELLYAGFNETWIDEMDKLATKVKRGPKA